MAVEALDNSANVRGQTRQRLLLTALHLYAQEGLDAVSLRRISADAGSRNSAAMHYHFSNKLGVIQALVEMIAGELADIAKQIREDEGEAADKFSRSIETPDYGDGLAPRETKGGEGRPV